MEHEVSKATSASFKTIDKIGTRQVSFKTIDSSGTRRVSFKTIEETNNRSIPFKTFDNWLKASVTLGLLHCRSAFIKPSTDSLDKSEIPQKPLIFTNLDILLIYTNLNDL